MSKYSPSSTISPITLVHVIRLAVDSGTISSSLSDMRSSGSSVSRIGGRCSQLAGKKER